MTPRRRIFAFICSVVAAFAAEVSGECSDAGVCVPGPVNAAVSAANRQVTVTATSTCGNPPARYCRVQPLNRCFICNESTHSVDKMTDENLSTSWQSVTWWEWYNNNNRTDEPLKVNVTLSFNKSYALTGQIRLIFKSPRPVKMVLEKSDDKGQTWTPLQYYAENCNDRFNMSSTPVESITMGDFNRHCVEEYSDFNPQEDGEVLFDFLRRYSKSDFWNETLQEYFTATDIRLQMLHPSTEGQNNLDIITEEIFNQYYYSVAELRVIARCQCHGHGEYCDYPDMKGKDCDCIHNTEGEDCERCKPLFNNKPWMPATSENEPNPCEVCQCYNHADSCHYNKTVDHGICDDCYHNTTGFFCEQCVAKFYRNMSKSLHDPGVCLSCDCFMSGITNNGTCNQTTGQCECKRNVTGRQCDECADTFWGFTLPLIGDCRECSCNNNGTKNGTVICNKGSGQCPCKDNIHQRTCSECKDGFYSFPTTVDADCLLCDCDYGGSIKEICEKENGTCLCRNQIEGKRCSEATLGFFVPSFDYLKYEAEEALGSYISTSYFTGVNQEFTGRGYGKIGQQQFIAFTVNNDRPRSFSFYSYIVVRYTSTKEDNVTLRLSVSSCNSSDCHETRNFTISRLRLGVGLAWVSKEPVHFQKGLVYHLNLTFISGVYFNSSIEIDSLILLPNVRDVRIFKVAQSAGSVHGMTLNQIEDCWSNSTSVAGLLSSADVCNNITFSVMAEVFDGAVACSCNNTGTENGTNCEKLRGQCRCKPGVAGRSCDHCLPGYFNFTDSGCTACNCSNLGSSDLVCDPVTGQCPCQPGVVTRTCSRCNASYFGFQSGQGCVECKCNANGSVDLQCNEAGVCPCKDSTSGTKCDMCKKNFFNFTSEGCQPCNCHKGGSSSLQCHLSTGICLCKTNAEGNKCERCKNGTYNSDPDNPTGCSPCFCYGRSNTCSSAQGFVKSYIAADFHRMKANSSKSGISLSILDRNTLVIDFEANSFISLGFTEEFKGNQVQSYGEQLKVTLNYSTVNDSLYSTWNIKLTGTNKREASFKVVPLPSASIGEHHVRLHEHYTRKNLTAFELQSILVDLESVQISGSFISNGSVTFSMRLVSASAGVGEEVGYVENCTCPSNYTRLSCGFCNSGYTRKTPNFSNTPNRLSSCVLCSCNGRSSDCYQENGTCYNCRTGSEGEYCQRCEPGVDNATDCRRCIPGYFGLTPSSGGCQECDCVLPNTIYGNSSVCNETTGQCSCKPKIGGRRCDRCHENAYNTSRGCVDCPECYRLVYVEVQKLRASASALENMIDRLRNGDIGDSSFAERLSQSENSVSTLVSGAEEARNIEKNLTRQIKDLNQTLNNLEHVLLQEVAPSMNELSSNLTSVLADRSSTEHLIGLIRDAVYRSHNVLNMSVDPSVREAEALVEYLSQLAQRFSGLASNFTAAATRHNDTAFEIKGKVDTAESRMTEAQFMTDIAVFEQNNLKTFLATLRMRVDVIGALGEVVNSTSYQLNLNASRVLARANEALSEVMLLEPNNTNTVKQIEAAATDASARARDVVSRAQNLTKVYSNLTLQVDLAVKEAKALMSRVSNVQGEGQAILEEARRARQEALDAVHIARKTFTDAQEMLQILRNFESKAREAQEFAELSLQRAIEANVTSWGAIQFARGINASLHVTMAAATRSLDLAKQAWNVSYNENQGVSIIHADASKLSQDAAQSKYSTGFLRMVEQNATSINSSSYGLVNACKQNYSALASNARQEAYSQKNEADKADAAARNLKARVDRVLEEVSRLQRVNITRLAELKNEIERIRAGFTQRNVTDIIRELKQAKEEQQKFVEEYREKVMEKREEISELKQLHASLPLVTCEKPSSGAILES